MPSLDGVHNKAEQVEVQPEQIREQESNFELERKPIPEPAPGPQADEGALLQAELPPILTEGPGSESGACAVSTSTIKRKLRIPPVTVRDFAKYMKSKKRADLNYEWEVREK